MKPRRETQQKAGRYLVAGFLTVELVHDGRIRATCRNGLGDEYGLGFELGEWWCQCPARITCSHLLALQRVVVAPRLADQR